MLLRAYYNEIDPFAVAVLKRRIADGSLPPGDVDDRDIRSVQAADLRGSPKSIASPGSEASALANPITKMARRAPALDRRHSVPAVLRRRRPPRNGG